MVSKRTCGEKFVWLLIHGFGLISMWANGECVYKEANIKYIGFLSENEWLKKWSELKNWSREVMWLDLYFRLSCHLAQKAFGKWTEDVWTTIGNVKMWKWWKDALNKYFIDKVIILAFQCMGKANWLVILRKPKMFIWNSLFSICIK